MKREGKQSLIPKLKKMEKNKAMNYDLTKTSEDIPKTVPGRHSHFHSRPESVDRPTRDPIQIQLGKHGPAKHKFVSTPDSEVTKHSQPIHPSRQSHTQTFSTSVPYSNSFSSPDLGHLSGNQRSQQQLPAGHSGPYNAGPSTPWPRHAIRYQFYNAAFPGRHYYSRYKRDCDTDRYIEVNGPRQRDFPCMTNSKVSANKNLISMWDLDQKRTVYVSKDSRQYWDSDYHSSGTSTHRTFTSDSNNSSDSTLKPFPSDSRWSGDSKCFRPLRLQVHQWQQEILTRMPTQINWESPLACQTSDILASAAVTLYSQALLF